MEYSYGSLTKSNYKCPWEDLNRTLACYDHNKCHLWLIKWWDLFLVCFSLSSISITFSPASAYKRLGTGCLMRNIIFFFFLLFKQLKYFSFKRNIKINNIYNIYCNKSVLFCYFLNFETSILVPLKLKDFFRLWIISWLVNSRSPIHNSLHMFYAKSADILQKLYQSEL